MNEDDTNDSAPSTIRSRAEIKRGFLKAALKQALSGDIHGLPLQALDKLNAAIERGRAHSAQEVLDNLAARISEGTLATWYDVEAAVVPTPNSRYLRGNNLVAACTGQPRQLEEILPNTTFMAGPRSLQ